MISISLTEQSAFLHSACKPMWQAFWPNLIFIDLHDAPLGLVHALLLPAHNDLVLVRGHWWDADLGSCFLRKHLRMLVSRTGNKWVEDAGDC